MIPFFFPSRVIPTNDARHACDKGTRLAPGAALAVAAACGNAAVPLPLALDGRAANNSLIVNESSDKRPASWRTAPDPEKPAEA